MPANLKQETMGKERCKLQSCLLDSCLELATVALAVQAALVLEVSEVELEATEAAKVATEAAKEAKEAKEVREAMAREEVSNRPHSPNRHRQDTEFLGDYKEVHKLWKTHLLLPLPSMEHMDHLCAFRSIPCKLRKYQ